MDRDAIRKAALDVAYLAACAVNGTVPDGERVRSMDIGALYTAAERHMLECITAMALESAGVRDPQFTQAKGKAVRKVAAFEMERARLFARLEQEGIWYMPLKGAVLKDLYPAVGMRQMSDNDILIDPEGMEKARYIMQELGFTLDFPGPVHDHYQKEPVFVFELHRGLFMKERLEDFYAYYRDVRQRLIRVPGRQFEYRFSDEDFYIYMIAHEYKHYAAGGTGLRSLLDTYVFCRARGETMDRQYAEGEAERLGIADFEARNRSLATHLFGGGDLTAEDAEMLDFIISSGTYGTVRNRVRNSLDKRGGGFRGKVGYIFRRIFLPMHDVRAGYPLFAKWPILLPFLPGYRLIKGITRRRNRLKAELRALSEYK